MNEKVTLTVNTNSPHIWRGGLTDTELAAWLVSKANALMYRREFNKKRQQARLELADAEACAAAIEKYTSLGVSSTESDPIQPASREAIAHAHMVAMRRQ